MEEEFNFNEIPHHLKEQAIFAIDFGNMLSDMGIDWSLEFDFREMDDWYGDELF